MKLVILGCGRVGARLAQLMEAEGNEISIINSDLDALQKLPDTFKGQTVLGTGIDADVLKAAGIEHADSFAAVTNYDNTNIMACQVAKEIFGVPHVLARIYDPGRESLYHELGLETICPTTLVSTTARDILNSLANKPVDTANTPSIAEQLNEGISENRVAVPATARTGNGTASMSVNTNTGESTPTPANGQQAETTVELHKAHQNGKGLRVCFNRNA